MNYYCNQIKLYSKNINMKMYDSLDTKLAEQYIYLGLIDKTFYFIHKINSDQFSAHISNYIYDIMIYNKMINSADYDVVIFEFNKNISKVIIAQHETNTVKKIYFVEELLNNYNQLLNHQRDNIFTILYNYKSSDYYVFELNTRCPVINLVLNNPELLYITTKINL
jgi:hypothetical protein